MNIDEQLVLGIQVHSSLKMAMQVQEFKIVINFVTTEGIFWSI